MGRRSYRRAATPPSEPTVVGQNYTQKAHHEIEQLARREVAAMVDWPWRIPEIADMIFPPAIRMAAEAARDIITPGAFNKTYGIERLDDSFRAPHTLHIDYSHSGRMPIDSNNIKLQPNGGPLITAFRQVREIYMKYVVVQHVFDWLNKHGSIGAMKYYCPSLVQICDEPRFVQADGQRFKHPEGVSRHLNLIKEASATLATVALLPKVEEPRTRAVHITFSAGSMEVDDIKVEAPGHTYNFGL